MSSLPVSATFEARHIGPRTGEMSEMLAQLGVSSLDTLIEQTVPSGIRKNDAFATMPPAMSEVDFLAFFKQMASGNKVMRSFIGQGYYDTITPPVVLRNILENPGWYTAYTPYQAEIAQGRLEMLLNFQTVVMELTGMPIANASLLDEATAAAEAVAMLYAVRKPSKKNAPVFLVDEGVFPQTLAVLQTRTEPLGIKLEVGSPAAFDVTRADVFGLLLQYPALNGGISDYSALTAAAHEHDTAVAFAADLLALTLIKSPGSMGADVVIGSAQRFGVPMGFGGPHAAFFATRDEYKRQLPGRIIGVSIDAAGNRAYRMALQTREQHIRRDKATSNICTAQVLLAVINAAYAVYHGPDGLKAIATRVNMLARAAAHGLKNAGFSLASTSFFDTITVTGVTGAQQEEIRRRAVAAGMNFRFGNATISIAFDEVKAWKDVEDVLAAFGVPITLNGSAPEESIPKNLERIDAFLTEPVFHQNRSEHDMLRYLKRLENKDLSLVHSMISLGSCTMKLNATTEMIPVTWPEWNGLHPFAPVEQTGGYARMFRDLERWLAEVTGFDAVSLQPNSGAQGEYAGLMVIRAWHIHRGEGHRNIALIPSSAHGTNPASAVMAGMKVVVVSCDERGNIDVADLKAKAAQYAADLSCLMITYPSTHGVFEDSVREICDVIHSYGGQVYMDGANMNAQVGLTSPGLIGADVCHLNLHKTFCIPHGGGGPGMGPIGVRAHLAPFLPGHPEVKTGGEFAIQPVSAAPFGSASILPISYAYICMMGGEGLTNATKMAILNANYMKARLEGAFKVLYTNENGRCAHEFILDMRPFKTSAGVEVEDIAKRLMDYGFHAPTVSFPVAGTIMIEPTESEPKSELDRFCDALLSIREEIREIEQGKAARDVNVLKNAPHTMAVITSDEWTLPYSRQKAAFPASWSMGNKFWPTVSRIDGAYGDRNLVCSCAPIEQYREATV
jgi:glycine dehydrogenase